MDVFEAMKTRRSIRKYKPGSILNEKLKMIFEAARLASSGGNRQPWRFVVIRNMERKRVLAKVANNQMFLADAAEIVVAIGDPEISKRWYDKDPMIAVEHMVLVANALGYGTCWIGAFEEEEIKRLLNILKEMSVIVLLSIGIPEETPQPKPRKEIPKIFFGEVDGTPIDLR